MEGNQKKITYAEILLSKEFQKHMNSDEVQRFKEVEEIIGNNQEALEEFTTAKELHNFLNKVNAEKVPDSYKKIELNKLLVSIANNSKFSIQNISRNRFLQWAASIILVLGLSVILSSIYIKLNSKDVKDLVYNEIIVPSGEKSQVILSDGTHIWLNSESKLRYPAQFTGNLRNVYLEGEAYFDVSKIKNSKFLVHTQDVKIEVLGTVFNVKSYPDEETVETSVVEGKVKVDAGTQTSKINSVLLLPKEKAVFNKKIATLESKLEKSKNSEIRQKLEIAKLEPLVTVSNINIKNIVCWKDHLLVFDNETFEEIAVKMSRWYKIHVVINDEHLKKQRFTGKFINNETYYQVLDAINYTTPIEYTIDNNQLTVISPPKHTLRR